MMSDPIPFSETKAEIVRCGRPFIKMHGLRNDFIIVDGRQKPFRQSAEEIVRICDRHEGVGGDELVIIEPPRSGSAVADAYAFMRIFNPDGREVEACGNATRCIGWLLMQESKREEVVIDTLGGEGKNMHRQDETLFIDSLKEKAKLSALFLMRLAAGEFTLTRKKEARK